MKQIFVMEKDPRARETMRRWDELDPPAAVKSDWEDIARLIRPQRGGFGLANHKNRDLEKPLSSEPILAASSFAAGIYSSITNPANRWVGLETGDEELNKWKPMAEWNDIVTRRVMASFGPAVSPFYSSTYQAYADIAAFGNAAGYDQADLKNRKFIDVTCSLAEVRVDIDAHGRVVEAVRKFSLKPRAIVREYGDKAVPAKVIEMAEKGDNSDIDIYQHVVPNDQFTKGKLGPKGKRWLSLHACSVDESLIRIAGFDEMPFYYPRWDVDSGMSYGTGPGFIALASARSVQLMDGASIRAAQKAADPTLLAPDRAAYPLNGVVRPGEVVYGGVNARGDMMVRPLDNIGAIGLTQQEKQAKVEAVKEAFHYSIMSLVGRTGVTNEETLIMEEARLRNWAPHADRIMEEYAARKVERRFAMLWRAGQLPPPPKEAEGVPLRMKYQSAAQQAMHARTGQAIRQFLGDLGPLAELDPRYADRLNADEIAEALHDASPSLPASILKSREEADQLAKARAEKQAQAEQMQMLQAGGGAAKDLAQAAGALPEGATEAMGLV